MKAKIALTLLLIFSTFSMALYADTTKLKLRCEQTIREFRISPATESFFDNSYGYAVFPTIGEGAFIIGGLYGEGLVYVGGKAVGRSEISGLSIGFQAGGQTYSQIIFFRDKTAFELFSGGSFSFGVSANATLITVGAQAATTTSGTQASAKATSSAKAAASIDYDERGMATFIFSGAGLMGSISVDGNKYSYTPLR